MKRMTELFGLFIYKVIRALLGIKYASKEMDKNTLLEFTFQEGSISY